MSSVCDLPTETQSTLQGHQIVVLRISVGLHVLIHLQQWGCHCKEHADRSDDLPEIKNVATIPCCLAAPTLQRTWRLVALFCACAVVITRQDSGEFLVILLCQEAPLNLTLPRVARQRICK